MPENATAEVTVLRIGSNLTNVTVDWRTVDSTASYKPHENNMYVPGNAAARSGDYARANGTLFFGVGVRRQTIRVNVLGDGTHDGAVHEKFALVLSNPAFPSGATSVVVSSQGGSTLTVGEPTLVDGMTTAYVEIADADPRRAHSRHRRRRRSRRRRRRDAVPRPDACAVGAAVGVADGLAGPVSGAVSPTFADGLPAPTISAEPTHLPTAPPTSPDPFPTVSRLPTSAPTPLPSIRPSRRRHQRRRRRHRPLPCQRRPELCADRRTVAAAVVCADGRADTAPSPSPTPFPSTLCPVPSTPPSAAPTPVPTTPPSPAPSTPPSPAPSSSPTMPPSRHHRRSRHTCRRRSRRPSRRPCRRASRPRAPDAGPNAVPDVRADDLADDAAPDAVTFAPTPTPTSAPRFALAASLTMAGMACSDYGATEEAAFVVGVAASIPHIDTQHIGDTTCADARRRLQTSSDNASSAVAIAFTIEIAVADVDDDTVLSGGGTALQSAIQTTLQSAISSGNLTSNIAAAHAAALANMTNAAPRPRPSSRAPRTGQIQTSGPSASTPRRRPLRRRPPLRASPSAQPSAQPRDADRPRSRRGSTRSARYLAWPSPSQRTTRRGKPGLSKRAAVHAVADDDDEAKAEPATLPPPTEKDLQPGAPRISEQFARDREGEAHDAARQRRGDRVRRPGRRR